MAIKKDVRRKRIRRGIRKKISGTAERPRLSVYRSNKSIYAQLIDDIKGHTVAYSNSREAGSEKGTKTEASREVGKKLAEKAQSQGVEKVVFDRGGYKYHGRVQALAEGAREGGLKF